MELWNEEINAKMIITTYEVADRKAVKKFVLGTIQTLTFAITQLVIALHWLCRGEGSNPGKPEFFSGNTVSFHNRASCVFNRNDRLCIYISDCY